MKRLGILAFFLVGATAACVPQTDFRGSAHYPGGPQACYASCQAQNMEMSSFIYSGEFASSCVCRPRSAPPPAPAGQPQPQASQQQDDEGDVATLAGVVMQMRRNNEQAKQNTPPPGQHK